MIYYQRSGGGVSRELFQDIESIKRSLYHVFDLPMLKTFISSMLVCYSWVFGINSDGVLSVLLLILIDTMTGFIRSYKEKDLNSYSFFKFAYKVSAYLILIITARLVDKVAIGSFFSIMVETFLAITEALSIIENLSQLGVPIPTVLIKRLKNLRDKKYEDILKDDKNGLQ